ncbi:hypothetical protein [Corallococcus silvisoli]|uniref:hypothetical protein n=1 Tax=Corallococcus silvisoli TaxID=2697031 RepID=UPI0013788D5E|nr:hypothetical protein [Corallococcus silvisoli]NBD09840.1 hypothetical protein [Corallococcus silvisoli]
MVARQWALALSLAVVSTSAFAQEGVTTGSFPVERRNVVTVSVPIQAGSTRVVLAGERVLGERFSLELGLFAGFNHTRQRFEEPWPNGAVGSNQTQYELGLTPGVRFYLAGRAPQGLWLSPRLEVTLGRASHGMLPSTLNGPLLPDLDANPWSVGGMAVLGYSVVVDPGFTVQAGVGVGAVRSANSYDQGTWHSDGGMSVERAHDTTWSFAQRLLLNLGWAF